MPLVISSIALALSAAQLFFTSPLIYEQFIAPRVIVEDLQANGNQIRFAGYVIRNVGRSSAKNVQLGILAMEGDEFTILPQLLGRVEKNDSVFLVTYTIILTNFIVVNKLRSCYILASCTEQMSSLDGTARVKQNLLFPI